jgi:cellulose synthase/poly-beta-1,6-N-acetylglucosamine synthase-like glycosyltransferase
MESELILAVYALCLAVLSIFGLNRYILVSLFRKQKRHEHVEPLVDSAAPTVTVQLPIYNELYVAERLVRSACELDYPRHLLEIQVLDDSTDETLTLTRGLVRQYQRKGINVVHLHRTDRSGFKAGALAYGLERARGDFVAVFDADFVIRRDFLRKTLPHFDSDGVGMVQARWSYLNDDFSVLTRASALGLDGHFVVEQAARYWGGLFLNFNGTAGVWRTRCIRDAGGWQQDTLTEDLDLSYRAQLKGWRFKYLWDLTCDSEIPPDIHAMKTQQFRWTKGSMETARKILPRFWKAKLPLWIKVQGTLHLIGNIVFPFFLVIGLLNLPVVVVMNTSGLRLLWPVSAYFLFTLFGTFSYYWTAQRAVHLDWRRRALYFPLFLGASIGLGVSNTQAVLEGLAGKRSPFVRTPKYSLVGNRRAPSASRLWIRWGRRYRSPVTWTTAGELLLGLYTLVTIGVTVHLGEYGALPFLFLFAFGYLLVGGYSLKHLSLATGRSRIPSTGVAGLQPSRLATSGRSLQGRDRRSRRRVVASTLIAAALLLYGLSSCRSGEAGKESDGDSRNAGSAVADAGDAERHDSDLAVQALAFPSTRPAGFEELPLVQKDRLFRIVPPEAGGAQGALWYRPAGEAFEWFVIGRGLPPDRAYRLLLKVDGTPYAVASLTADPQGRLRGYGVLESFREQICVSAEEFDPPRLLAGPHELYVWILDDGARSASGRTGLLGAPTAEDLPCSGNGDGSFEPRLVEFSAIRFRGG